MNLPNKLTVLRVCLIPVFVLLLLLNIPHGRYLAAGVFVIASLTDLLDGYIARSRNLVTDLGKFLDPLADKLLVASAVIAMVELELIPAWGVIIIISREFVITGFRLVAAGKGIVLASDKWGKIKTATQMIMIIILLLGFQNSFWTITGDVLIYLSIILSLVSAGDYLYKNKGLLKD